MEIFQKNKNDIFGSVTLAAENHSLDNDSTKDSFWLESTIQPERWNQSFPYQLILVKKDPNTGNYTQDNNWVFTLPIPPESLTFSMPYSIDVAATQGGVVEEHSGAKFRIINISGTTGVIPLKGTGQNLKAFSLGEGIFAGTIARARNVVSAGTDFVNNFNSISKQNLVSPDDTSNDKNDIAKTTGYFQFRLLQQFLERYVAFKQTDKGEPYRLALAMWKDQGIYLVTPQGSFTISRAAGSPYKYSYSMQFKAWRRIELKQSANTITFRPTVRDPNKLSKILKATYDARRVLQDSKDVILAIGGDLDRTILEPLRQAALLAKDILGVPIALADMPNNVISSAKETVIEFLGTKQAFEGFGDFFKSRNDDLTKSANEVALLAGLTEAPRTGPDGSNENSNTDTAQADSANAIFENPLDHFEFFSAINIGELSPRLALSNQIRGAINDTRSQRRIDWEQKRDAAISFLVSYENAIGAGNDTYNLTYSSGVNNVNATPTEDNFQIIYSINDTIDALSVLASSEEVNNFVPNAINFIAGLATQSGIAFQIPRSKFQVPFPYGSTLEELAFKYLNDPDRWMEIVALNGLVPPYIDEEGFDVPLLVNGLGNTAIVADASNLFVGQIISVISNIKNRSIHTVTAVKKVGTGIFEVSIDGDPLNGYNVIDRAVLHAFTPGTVNSQMSLYIPSDRDPEVDDFRFKPIPGLKTLDPLFEVGGVSFLLTPKNDLVLTPNGETRLAVGLTNILQTARIMVSVTQGTLLRHPTFGLPLVIGNTIANLDPNSIIQAVKTMFRNDPTFTEVKFAQIVINGPSSVLNFTVGIRGLAVFLPISLTLT